MIATLPMYDRPETAEANDALWSLIRDALGHGPETLDRTLDLFDGWLHPDLVLSQTCSLPHRTRLAGRVTYVCGPDMRLEGCPAGYYNSVFIARKTDDRPLADLLQARVAINQSHSESGWGAMHSKATARGMTVATPTETGAHGWAARGVAEGRADVAVIDANTWRQIRRYDDWAETLREIDRTRPTPAMPFITAAGNTPEPLAAALATAIESLPPAHQDALGLYGTAMLPEAAFIDMPNPPEIAAFSC
jgi:hypothetical protein